MLKKHEWTTEENFLLNFLNDFYKGEYFFYALGNKTHKDFDFPFDIGAVNKIGERVLHNKVCQLISKTGMHSMNSGIQVRVSPEEIAAAINQKPYLNRRDTR